MYVYSDLTSRMVNRLTFGQQVLGLTLLVDHVWNLTEIKKNVIQREVFQICT